MSTAHAIGEDIPNKRQVDAEVGRRIHMLMWDHGLTQTTFGAAIGVDQSALAKRLRGKAGWSLAEVVNAANYFNVPIGYLFGEGDDVTAPKLRPKD